MAYAFDLWGWYTGEVPTGTQRSTPATPTAWSTADTPGEPRANWTGIAWQTLPYVAPPPAPPTEPVPAQVTRRQAKQALLLAGLLGNVQPAIDAIPDATQRALAQLEWDESLNFERHRPILIALAGALGLDSDDLDDLFRTAATL